LLRHETARSLRHENRRQPANLSFPGDHFYLNSSGGLSAKLHSRFKSIAFAKKITRDKS